MADPDPGGGPALPLPLQAALDKFRTWVANYLKGEEGESQINAPLYHYTDGRGLKGILESGRIWFTDYRHLNDPSEVLQGMEFARDVARHLRASADPRARLFLDCFIDMFRHENIETTLQFYIASFSREHDDLGQWRAYADNGRGFAIGFAPHLFSVVEERPTDRPPEFVGPVSTQAHPSRLAVKHVAKHPTALRRRIDAEIQTAAIAVGAFHGRQLPDRDCRQSLGSARHAFVPFLLMGVSLYRQTSLQCTRESRRKSAEAPGTVNQLMS